MCPRNVREAISMTSQQHGCLYKTSEYADMGRWMLVGFKPRQRTVGKWGMVRAEEMILPHRKSSKIGYPIPSAQPWDQPRLRYSYRCTQITLFWADYICVFIYVYIYNVCIYVCIYVMSTHYKWTIIAKGWTWERPRGCMREVRERMKGKNDITTLKV